MADPRVQAYLAFLKSPRADQLLPNARVTYVTSAQVYSGAEAILSNAILNARHVKKSEKIISTHVASDSIVFETVTTIEFVNGTGSYVTGLDKNFVVDNTVILPVIHSVIFDVDKIKSVRLFWDQATMLKQLNIIGSRGNSWPIVSGSDQENLMISDAVPSNNPAPVVEKTEAFTPRKKFDISQLEPEIEVVLPRPAVVPAAPSSKPEPRSFQDMIDAQTGPLPQSPRRQGKAPEAYDIFDEKNQKPLPARHMKGPAPATENLSTPSHVRAKRFNSKNFEPHFKFGTPDQKPSPYSKTRANMHPQPDEVKWDYNAEVGIDEKLVTGQDRHDHSSNLSQRFNGIKIAGNGMGGRGKPQWSLNMGADDSDARVLQNQGSSVRKDLADSSRSQTEDQSRSNGIKIAGNGMGGRGKPQWSWDTGSEATEVSPSDRTTMSTSAKPAPLEMETNTGNINKDPASSVELRGSMQPEKQEQGTRFNGIKIFGNGMGGRGKPSWSWDMNESEDNVPAQNKYQGRITSHRQFVSSWSFGNDESEKEN
ncbi:hypothetical protein V1509DRAFT_655822 [Lipomyces kononenkoae]